MRPLPRCLVNSRVSKHLVFTFQPVDRVFAETLYVYALDRYENAFYAPMLSDWRNFETWSESGAEQTATRANRIWKQLLADYQQPPLDAAIDGNFQRSGVHPVVAVAGL